MRFYYFNTKIANLSPSPHGYMDPIDKRKTICYLFPLWFCSLTNPPKKKEQTPRVFNRLFSLARGSAASCWTTDTRHPRATTIASSISMNLNMTPKSTKVKSAIPRSSSWSFGVRGVCWKTWWFLSFVCFFSWRAGDGMRFLCCGGFVRAAFKKRNQGVF